MSKFRVGDKVIAIENVGFTIQKGNEYTVEEADNEKDDYIALSGCPGYWGREHFALEGTIIEDFRPGGIIRVPEDYFKTLSMPTEPKQRTIEDVRVGDITVEADNKNPAEVVEVLKNIFAYIWNNSVQWITFKRAKELGWKIKQPEPEELEHECTTLCLVSCPKRKATVCTHCGK